MFDHRGVIRIDGTKYDEAMVMEVALEAGAVGQEQAVGEAGDRRPPDVRRRLAEAPGFGQPITQFDPASRGAMAYRRLAIEMRNQLGPTARVNELLAAAFRHRNRLTDVERYLTDQPVEACPPSRTYRMRKFARRNKATLTTAASSPTR